MQLGKLKLKAFNQNLRSKAPQAGGEPGRVGRGTLPLGLRPHGAGAGTSPFLVQGVLLSVRASRAGSAGKGGGEKRKARGEDSHKARPLRWVHTGRLCDNCPAPAPNSWPGPLRTARLPASTPAPAASRVRPPPRPLQVQSLSLSCPSTHPMILSLGTFLFVPAESPAVLPPQPRTDSCSFGGAGAP